MYTLKKWLQFINNTRKGTQHECIFATIRVTILYVKLIDLNFPHNLYKIDGEQIGDESMTSFPTGFRLDVYFYILYADLSITSMPSVSSLFQQLIRHFGCLI